MTAIAPSNKPPELKLLLVEDDPALRDLLLLVLGQEPGLSLATAANGPEALEACRAAMPDILILDILLPQMNGLELLRTLHAEAKLGATYVLVISGLGYQEVIQQAVEAGADDFIVKPLDTEFLVQRLQSGLRRQPSALIQPLSTGWPES